MASSSLSGNHEKSEYQVFLSFHRKDVYWGFLSHLISALKRKQIRSFDDTQLERTKAFEPELFRMIEESDLSIVIFSENFPKSEYCMKEIEKMHKSGCVAFPVFHKVDTDDVQNRVGNYNIEEEEWKEALKYISDISGADSKIYQTEAQLVEYIVETVSRILVKICPKISSHDEGLFGISSSIIDVEDKLQFDSMKHVVRLVGIWGVGGIGKTTIAYKVFDRNKEKFQGHCFISNVSETLKRVGPTSLTEKIVRELLRDETIKIEPSGSVDQIIIRLKRLRVLLVLDDVHDCLQLKSVLENSGLNSGESFCHGSRIIVTSRDRQVLRDLAFGSRDIYDAHELNNEDALKLLCWGAFRQNKPPPEYEYIATKVVKYAHGIPMAVVVLGTYLKQKEPSQWEDALKKINAGSAPEIQKVLRSSYDDLDRNEKKIFLDIACFLKGKKRDYVINVLDAFGFHARVGIDRLIDKSLVKEEKGDDGGVIITMHDLLEQMGQEIVAEEQDRERHQSRLWTIEDIHEALMDNKGTENVEVISYEGWRWDPIEIKPEAFTNMWKLRYLKLRYCPTSPAFLPYRLKFLCWDNFSQTYWPTGYNLGKLVELHLKCSELKKFSLTKPHVHLKVISLHRSKDLIKITDWGMMPNIEVVDLGYCTSLVEIGSSLENLYNLTNFSVHNCESLTHLPELPHSVKEMDLNGCGVRKLPSTVGHLYQLKRLSLRYCEQLENLPTTLSGLMSLEVMDLHECSSLVEMGSSLKNLKNLTRLDISRCKRLSLLPELPSGIVELVLFGSGLKQLPSTIGHLTRLKELSLEFCSNLDNLEQSNISNLTSLEKLDIVYCRNLQRLPEDFGNMESLKELSASYSGLTELPQSIKKLSKLIKIDLTESSQLKSVPALPSNLELFDAMCCKSLLNKVKSSIVEQYRRKVHDQPTKTRRLFIDRRQLPKWMMYRHRGASISLNLQTSGRPIDIIFGVVASSNFALSCINPVAVVTMEKSETYRSIAYPDEASRIWHYGQKKQSHLFMWNCSIDCKFLKEVSFELMSHSGNEEIVKCGVHQIMKKKNKSNRSKEQEKKHLNDNYNLASLFME